MSDDLKHDSENENDKVNMPSFPSPKPTVSYFRDLDFFKDFENEFPVIVYNDALMSKSYFLTEPVVSPQHIDEFNLKDETSLSECDEEEQNILYFNDLFPFNIIYPDDLKSDKDNKDGKIDIKHSSGGNVINTDDGAYAQRVNERQMQTTEEKVDMSNVLNASLVDTESSGIKSGKHDTSRSSGNDVDADDTYIKPIYDEERMDEEKGFAIAALKNELRKLTGNSMNTKFAKSSILEKLVLKPHRNQSVVRQPTAFKSERPRISKPSFASQVDVNNNLSKPDTTHYLPKEREFVVVKPHHVISSSESRNSSKNMPRFSSNDMVHNHYLEEAKKKTQERGRNSRPSVMPSTKSQSTANCSKSKPRINN
ncbi:hypothetical protein Tco_1273809 [Tanacetum coccineum]